MSGKISWWRPRLSQTGEKVRNVLVLIYMEDLERVGKTYGDLIAYLDHIHVRAIVSPIHDHDAFSQDDVIDWRSRHFDKKTGDVREEDKARCPEVGQYKKPHVHVGIMNGGPLDADHWTAKLDGLLHVRETMWERMESYTASLRYFAHLDSPDKYQYSPFDIVGIGGVDMSDLLKEDNHQTLVVTREIFDYCESHKVKSYRQLFQIVMRTGSMDWQSNVMGRAPMWRAYLGSGDNKKDTNKKSKHVDDVEEMLG